MRARHHQCEHDFVIAPVTAKIAPVTAKGLGGGAVMVVRDALPGLSAVGDLWMWQNDPAA